ncbi:hypothetical protein CQW23_24956 [Capsicum baccatum]|uniref:Uncharacterized protein n=1 Tax=Capsicum baccatum TaxID=33114 RepID=A0A2G2VWA4_CAPBA|nr:hypothetical protein CQW23_24956 [Capsicum baccatum]
MSIAEFVLVSGDFMGEWVETSKCWTWRSFTKVTIPIHVRRNSSYDEFVASIMQSGDLDCAPNGFRPILRINVIEGSFEGPLNSSAPPPRRPTVDDDFIDDDLNDYENDADDRINMEDYSMYMEDFSSDSQDDEEDREMESQIGHSFTDGTNFYCG